MMTFHGHATKYYQLHQVTEMDLARAFDEWLDAQPKEIQDKVDEYLNKLIKSVKRIGKNGARCVLARLFMFTLEEVK